MTKKLSVLSLAVALTLGLVAFISGSAGRGAASPASNALNALPASDIVVTVDTQRLLSETLPAVLVDNPTLLAKVNEKIERCNQELGIDLRNVDSVAVGLRFNSSSNDDFDGVAIVRGRFNAGEAIDAGLAAAKRKNELQKTEEQYEGKTIIVITPQRIRKTESTSSTANSNGKEETVAVLSGSPADANALRTKSAPQENEPTTQYDVKVRSKQETVAVVALDANTIAAGDLKSVRAAIDASLGRERVDDELVRMATQNPSALVGFSGRIPTSVTEKIAASNRGTESKYMASIREFYGSFSTTGADAQTFIAVRTENAGQAHDISQALNAMKLLSGFSMTRPAKGELISLADVLKDLSITSQDNEVQIKLNIKQKDIAPFMRRF
jgi:hypothetical protein